MEYPEHEGVRVGRIREYTVLAQQFAVLIVYNYTVNCVGEKLHHQVSGAKSEDMYAY